MFKSEEAAVSPQTVACSFPGCPLPRRCDVQRPHGLAPVCKVHYEQVASMEAERCCRRLGITSAQQAHPYVVERMKRIGSGANFGIGWAHRILERAAAGEKMPHVSLLWAREALPPIVQEREPGEDESEVMT